MYTSIFSLNTEALHVNDPALPPSQEASSKIGRLRSGLDNGFVRQTQFRVGQVLRQCRKSLQANVVDGGLLNVADREVEPKTSSGERDACNWQ